MSFTSIRYQDLVNEILTHTEDQLIVPVSLYDDAFCCY